MAFSIGDLIARLRVDSKQFDAGMTKAAASLTAVETAAVKADTAVTTGMKRATASTSPYVRAVRERLATEREVLATRRAGDREYQLAHAAALSIDQRRTRTMGRLHAEALRMNAAFDAGGRTAGRAGTGINQMSNALRSVAIQMSGVHPLAGRLLGTMGQFAVGTAVMAGVFAGIAGLAALFAKLGEEARKAAERVRAAKEEADKLAVRSLPASIDLLSSPNTEQLRTERERLQDELTSIQGQIAIARQDAPRNIDSQRELERLEAREVDTKRELASATRALNIIEATAAELAEEEAEARTKVAVATELQAASLGTLNRRLAESMVQARSEFAALLAMGNLSYGAPAGRTRVGGRWLADQRLTSVATPFSRNSVFDANRRMAFPSDNPINQTYERFRRLVPAVDKTKDRISQFGEGAKKAFEGFIDAGALGANLAGQGIGMIIGALGDALFGPRYVDAIEENTRALKRLSGDTSELEKFLQSDIAKLTLRGDARKKLEDFLASSRFSTGIDMAKRRIEAADLSVGDQFKALQQVLVGGLGTSTLRNQALALTPETVGEFLTKILDQISAGTFDIKALGRTPLTDFIDLLAEMESLGDAAGDAASELGDLASTLRNAPAGFKVDFARFSADTGRAPSLGEPWEKIVIEGDMIVVANDPDELGNEVRRQTRRGGTNAMQLATRPAGGFVRGGV